jgi:hypothetical protein
MTLTIESANSHNLANVLLQCWVAMLPLLLVLSFLLWCIALSSQQAAPQCTPGSHCSNSRT